MKNDKVMKLTVIGAGNMGGALVRGWAKSGGVENLTVADRNETLLARFREAYPSIRTTTDNREAVRGADVVTLVVKPWLMPVVLDELRGAIDPTRQAVVSHAARCGTDFLRERLNQGGNYFYAIPNIAAEFGQSMTFIASCREATAESQAAVQRLYALVGDTLLVDEPQVEAGMLLSSCGLAYVMRYVRALMLGGCELGFPPEQAKRIALQTMQGAVSLLRGTDLHPEAAIDKVTTPGGVTIQGLNELDHAGFTSAVLRSLKVARQG